MALELTHFATQGICAPREKLFTAILSQDVSPASVHRPGAFLSIKSVWGKPGTIGHQSLARINWGAADLVMKETTLNLRPPELIELSQQPQALLPYDPAERLPPIGHETPANLDKIFASTYGTPPVTTIIRYDLEESDMGSLLRVTITARFETKPGWLKRRRWKQLVPAEINAIFARITAALGAG